MTSRFRSNWAKEGPKSTSPTFDPPARSDPAPVDFGCEYRGDYCRVDSEGNRRNGSRSARDISSGDRNGKSRDRNGIAGGCYGDERELDNESESPDMNYHRRYRPDFRCRSGEVEESARERRPLSGKKGAIGVGPASATHDLVEDEAEDVETPGTILPAPAMTNGESLVGITGNGSAKQVRRSEERRGASSGSLTRERIVDLSSAIHRTVDVTNRSTICTSEKSNGNGRERSTRRFSRSENNDKLCETEAAGRVNEIEVYTEKIDRRRSRRSRDRSHSIEDVANGNGNSSSRRSEARRRETGDQEKFYSPARRVAQDLGSMDRRSRRHAKGPSYSEEEDDARANGNFEARATRSDRRERPTKDEEFGSMTRRSSRAPFDERALFADNGNDSRHALESNGSRGENGNPKKYSEIDNDDNSLSRKETSKRKSHTHHKTSPDEFDVQIHRYERALRAPRRDSDSNKKASFRDHDSGLSRKNSLEDRHRSRDPQSKKSSHKHRDPELTGRGSSEDRDEQWKSSFRNRDASSTRKSSLTNRNLDTGATNNNNTNNGSHHRDHSGSSRRDRDPSRDRRRSSRANINDEEDQDRSSWKNDRHSRPLTPPTSLEDVNAQDDSRDRRSIVSSFSRHRHATNEDEFAHKYAPDRSDCRGNKTQEGADVIQERDRFSSSTRRVASSRSFNESRKDSSRISRIEAGNKHSSRDHLVDHKDLLGDERNSDFSTIERNGTTVIRIRTNSESPVGHLEPRSRRRTSHQEVGAGRYRKYEDEAEDEDEDDEAFERDNQRREGGSWKHYKAGQRRLWSGRDGSVQITDLDDGQPCLHCGETCPGFSPHTWSVKSLW